MTPLEKVTAEIEEKQAEIKQLKAVQSYLLRHSDKSYSPDSSFIRLIEWSNNIMTVHIECGDDSSKYSYEDINGIFFEEFQEASSAGRFFNQHKKCWVRVHD